MPSTIYLLALAIFCMTTSEFMVAGMMNELALAFQVSVSSIGYLITAYAGAMVIGGPILTAILLRIRSKQALLFLMFVFLIGQSLGAIAWNYDIMMISRIITGIASSSAFGVAISYSATLVHPTSRGKAASIVLAGLMIATVIGLPITTVISQYFGWRASFWAVSVLVLVSGIMIQWLLPSSSIKEQLNWKDELIHFKSRHLWAAYITSMFIIGGTFAAFSYFTPIFTNVTGFSSASIPYLLALYGSATVVGNIVIGKFADKFTMKILMIGLIILILAMSLFALGAENKYIAVISTICIGLTGVALNPAMIARVMKTARNGAMINTVHSSFITLGVVIGSSLGGLGISKGHGFVSPLWIGVCLAILGLISLIPYLRKEKAE
ncbi:MFS transporter [Bacillus thuringiensis serovar pingluonsis]|uniref:MFS transporter n=1 Tax=Bacillus thuringiensis serovar pingluonsis TaxID=180881 RepID=A0A243BSQ7_BACTU|nr:MULTISPECIES: MFS transporter [Bacillus cereus group]MEB9680987.1 MFS transporter [Bacillus anthracis]OTY49606.1 MFS transporter [Bacillus thuringiensis serovar pingluonsis]PGZ45386.1 MFS transporter [Bacillus anthracis]